MCTNILLLNPSSQRQPLFSRGLSSPLYTRKPRRFSSGWELRKVTQLVQVGTWGEGFGQATLTLPLGCPHSLSSALPPPRLHPGSRSFQPGLIRQPLTAWFSSHGLEGWSGKSGGEHLSPEKDEGRLRGSHLVWRRRGDPVQAVVQALQTRLSLASRHSGISCLPGRPAPG